MIIAAFVSVTYMDLGRLRVWSQQLDRDAFVLLTDMPHEPNRLLARALRCASICHALVPYPCVARTLAELQTAQIQRDRAMFSVAQRIVVFGAVRFDGVQLPENVQRYPG